MLLKRTVLLVEDNQDDVELILHAFNRHGFSGKVEVVVAKDGVEALDFLFVRGVHKERSLDDLPQVVLLDVNLPLVNGFEVLKQIRGNSTTQLVPVVMLSASNEPCDVAESFALGANSYVQKSVNRTAFFDCIGEVARYWLTLNEPLLPIAVV